MINVAIISLNKIRIIYIYEKLNIKWVNSVNQDT